MKSPNFSWFSYGFSSIFLIFLWFFIHFLDLKSLLGHPPFSDTYVETPFWEDLDSNRESVSGTGLKQKDLGGEPDLFQVNPRISSPLGV